MRPVCMALALLVGCSRGNSGPTEQTTLDLTLPDEDRDTIMDHHEGTEEDDWYDFDGDGVPNWQDEDSDQDGISDAVEAGDADLITFPVDSDQDGLADFVDLDSDGNCLDDATEGSGDLDADAILDFTDVDDDGDAILDRVEIGAGCAFPDSDGDGDADYRDSDSDDDGIADLFEGGTTLFSDEPVDTDDDGTPDYLDQDSDGDGLDDRDERGGNQIFEPPRDTDGDGVGDYADDDSDGDGLSDADEVGVHGTDPYDDDTDGDTFSDGSEIAVGVDPTDPGSIIEGIYVEVPARTDVEEVFVFELSIEQGDIAFLIDTTCSMQTTLNAMAGEFSQIVNLVTTALPDAQYGVATFDDYNYGGMGSGLDRPFILQQQVTSDTTRVQGVLSGITLHNGVDIPESGTEAVFQALSGQGYDQDCDGAFDGGTDVPPFVASATDPFGGAGPQAHTTTWPGGGTNGGMGFRDYALPIVVYATDADMRNASTYPTPGGCPGDADGTDVSNAAAALGAKLIGIEVVNGDFNDPTVQMQALADSTGSYADLDGDGATDDRLVFSWNGGNAAFRTTIVDAIDQLVGAVTFAEVTLEVVGDDQGFVIGIDPPVYYPTGAVSGEVIDFTLTFRGTDAPSTEDELHVLTLNVIGDGTVLLDTLEIYVVVPGTTL